MIEVTPIDDLKEHTSGSTCQCEPKIIWENGEMIVVHNSWDGREAVEEFYSILEEKTDENRKETE